MQTLDERLDVAMSTLSNAEQRLSLAEQSEAQHMQQHISAQHRCAYCLSTMLLVCTKGLGLAP